MKALLLAMLVLAGVSQAGLVQLAWDNPTNYTDGSAVTLVSNVVYRGTNAGVYNVAISISARETYLMPTVEAFSLLWAATNTSSVWAPTQFTVSWGAPVIVSTLTNYFAVTAVGSRGCESDYSEELAALPDVGIALVEYRLMWGTAVSGGTNTIHCGTNVTFTGVPTNFPRTTLYMRVEALLSDQRVVVAPMPPIVVNNRKQGAPVNLKATDWRVK